MRQPGLAPELAGLIPLFFVLPGAGLFHHRKHTQRSCGMNKPLSLFLAALLFGSSAMAQQQPRVIAESGFYFGFDLGTVMMLKDRSEEIAALIARKKGANNVEVEQSAGTTAVRLFGGHVINRHIASELGLIVTGPLGVYVSGSTPPTPPATAASEFSQNASISFYGLDASVLFRPYPYPSRPFPYKLLSGVSLRAGGHYLFTSSDISGYPLASASGGGVLYGFNFDWPLGDGLFRIGYTQWNDIAGVADNSGPVLTLGYLWRF